jgi:hypothetical protein
MFSSNLITVDGYCYLKFFAPQYRHKAFTALGKFPFISSFCSFALNNSSWWFHDKFILTAVMSSENPALLVHVKSSTIDGPVNSIFADSAYSSAITPRTLFHFPADGIIGAEQPAVGASDHQVATQVPLTSIPLSAFGRANRTKTKVVTLAPLGLNIDSPEDDDTEKMLNVDILPNLPFFSSLKYFPAMKMDSVKVGLQPCNDSAKYSFYYCAAWCNATESFGDASDIQCTTGHVTGFSSPVIVGSLHPPIQLPSPPPSEDGYYICPSNCAVNFPRLVICWTPSSLEGCECEVGDKLFNVTIQLTYSSV